MKRAGSVGSPGVAFGWGARRWRWADPTLSFTRRTNKSERARPREVDVCNSCLMILCCTGRADLDSLSFVGSFAEVPSCVWPKQEMNKYNFIGLFYCSVLHAMWLVELTVCILKCGPFDFAVDFPAQFSFQMIKSTLFSESALWVKDQMFSTSINGPSVNNIGSVKNTVCNQHHRPQTQFVRGLDHLQQPIKTIKWIILEQRLNKKAKGWMKHK